MTHTTAGPAERDTDDHLGAPAAAPPARRPPRRLSAAQRTAPYVDALRAYVSHQPLRLGVPGHKGGPGAAPALRELFGDELLGLDVSPILWGVDHGDAVTPMDRALALAAEAWGARRTWFMTNGASMGNHAVCLALRALGRQVLMQRSVHSSAVDGVILAGLEPRFVAPTIDHELGVAHGIAPETLERALAADPSIDAVYLVSPSYFGAVADVGRLARIAHAAGALLVVDEAWGAHFGFHPALPPNALSLGADVVVSSTHKTVGSLTQSAMLHLGDGPFADLLERPLARGAHLLQSTSSSALLYASLDLARQRIASAGERLLDDLLRTVGALREQIRAIDGFDVVDDAFLRHPDVVAIDPLHVVIDCHRRGLTGYELGARLVASENVDLEAVSLRGAVALFGVGEGGTADAERLLAALRRVPWRTSAAGPSRARGPLWGEAVLPPREAFLHPTEVVPAEAAVGRLSAATIAAYPPGIPNLLPGERITGEILATLHDCCTHGGHVRGAYVPDVSHLRVVVE
jgi:lysine decarboxylase